MAAFVDRIKDSPHNSQYYLHFVSLHLWPLEQGSPKCGSGTNAFLVALRLLLNRHTQPKMPLFTASF